MSAGTGLPLPQGERVLAQPAQIVQGASPAPLVHAAEPGPVVRPADVASLWENIAAQGRRIESAGEGLASAGIRETGAAVAGYEQTAKIVTHGIDTQLHQIRVGQLADFEVQNRDKFTKLRDQFSNDPVGYENAVNEHINGALGEVPSWMTPHAKEFLSREKDSGMKAVLSERRATDKRLDQQSITARLRDAEVAVMTAADTDGFASPQGKAALAEHSAVLDAAVSSRLVSQDEADRRKRNLFNRATTAEVVRDIGETYQALRANGEEAGPASLRAAEERILRNPNLQLSEQDRYAYYHKATAEIRAMEAERKQDLHGARAGMSDAISAMTRGVQVAPEAVDMIADQLSKAGGQAEVAKLRAAQARAAELDTFNKLPLPEQTRQLGMISAGASASSPQARAAFEFFTAKGYTPAQASGIVGNLIQENPSFNPAQSHDGGTGIGIAGWRLERRQALEAFASAQGKPVTDFQTQLAFIDHELNTTEGTAGAALRAAKTPQEAALAFIHFERPRGYTPESPERGHGATNRIVNAGLVAGVHDPASPEGKVVAGIGADFKTVGAEQSIVAKRADAMWTDISKDMDQGVRPNTVALEQVIQAATLAGSHGLLETIGARLDRFDQAALLQQRPLGEQQSVITDLERTGARGNLPPGAAAWKKDVEARYAATNKGLDENPIGFTATQFPTRFGTPAQLDPNNSETFRAGLSYRAKVAQFAAENWKVPARSALDKGDLEAVHAALDRADPAGKARIFSDLTASLPEDVRNVTLGKLGEKGPQAMVEAYAGALYGQDPAIATSIVRGRMAMKADIRNDPMHEDAKKKDFNAALDEALPEGAFSLEGRTNPSGGYATIRNAAIARYADLTAQDPNTKHEFSETRLRQAVTDVTGGIMLHNGGSLIAPSRGMTQRQFDGVMSGVTDADLAGVTTLGGQPVTANYLRGSAKLESVGDGRYLVRLGNDPSRPIYAFNNANTESPMPFVLDLRGRRPPAPDFTSGTSFIDPMSGLSPPGY